MPLIVRIGMRSSNEETEEKASGSVVGGFDSGRKPREKETVNGDMVESPEGGGIEVRTGKDEDSIVEYSVSLLDCGAKRRVDENK